MDRRGKLKSEDHYTYYFSLRRSRLALIVKKRVQNAVLGRNLKNDRIICLFQDKLFNISVIHTYTTTTDAEEAELTGSIKIYNTFYN